MPSTSPKLLNLDQEQPSKKLVFLVKSLQHWGYDNFSYTEMLELPNFGDMTACTIYLSHMIKFR